MTHTEPPNGLNSLKARIANAAKARNSTSVFIQRVVANTVLSQLLPPGVIKGGTALKLRLGEQNSRFTADFDMARATDLDAFLAELADNLTTGWHGFTGHLKPRRPAQPTGVPTDYVMLPYDVKMTFKDRAFMTITFELGHDEIGDTNNPDFTLAADIITLFTELGLPNPRPIAILPIHHQIAKKLHACTAPGNERAHDLVDLQLISHLSTDLSLTSLTTQRLFRSRNTHPWPPLVTPGPTWPGLYTAAAEGLNVLPDVQSATQWANDYIATLASTPHAPTGER